MKTHQTKFISLSYLEGFFYSIMVASSESYALFFSVKQGLSDVKLAIISTIPLLIGAFAQWAFPRLLGTHRLRDGIILSMSIQMLGLAGLFYNNFYGFSFIPFFLSMCLYWVGGMTAGPLWLDWMSSFFPKGTFRTFLGKRNSFILLNTLTVYLTLSFFSDQVPVLDKNFIFFLGVVARFLSLGTHFTMGKFIKKQKESNQELIIKDIDTAFSFSLFHKSSPSEIKPQAVNIPLELNLEEDKVKKILLQTFFWTSIFKFAVSISSPFFLPFMVHDLKLSLWHYSILTAMPMLGKSLFFTSWGGQGFGVRPFIGLQFCSIFISLIPVMWTLNTNYYYLMGMEFASGVLWSGFDLSAVLITQNLISQGTARAHGLHMALMNVFSVLGSYIGGVLLHQHYSYHFVFYLSSSLRMLVAFFFIWNISRFKIADFEFSIYREYLTSVFSIKPSLNHLSRMILPLGKLMKLQLIRHPKSKSNNQVDNLIILPQKSQQLKTETQQQEEEKKKINDYP